MNWHLFFILWVSGSWKWTLRKNLEKQNLKNLVFLKSYVTREMRPWEIDGDIYNFISEEDFKKEIEKNNFLEYAFVHKTAYYGTKKSDVLDGIKSGKIMIKEIEIQWLKKIKKDFPELEKNYTSIFLDIPAPIIRERILKRDPNTSEEEIQYRLESMVWEQKASEEICDFIIDTTKTPEKVLNEVLKIIKK